MNKANKHFVTFGQIHTHSVNGKTFDKDCIAVFPAKDHKEGRDKAFKYFGTTFGTSYQGEDWDEDNMKFFPRGYIELP